MAPQECLVNEAIREALADAAGELQQRGIIVEARLEATYELVSHDPLLWRSLYTIVRGLPARVARGSRLSISTVDRAGGDIELVWRASALAPDVASPHADLMGLALVGLQTFCRSRGASWESEDDEAGDLITHATFLIPSLERDESWHPVRRS